MFWNFSYASIISENFNENGALLSEHFVISYTKWSHFVSKTWFWRESIFGENSILSAREHLEFESFYYHSNGFLTDFHFRWKIHPLWRLKVMRDAQKPIFSVFRGAKTHDSNFPLFQIIVKWHIYIFNFSINDINSGTNQSQCYIKMSLIWLSIFQKISNISTYFYHCSFPRCYIIQFTVPSQTTIQKH